MNRRNKRQVSNPVYNQERRRRVELKAEGGADVEQPHPELPASEDDENYTTESSSNGGDVEPEPEEEEILEEEDDDEYAEFRKQSDAALGEDLSSVKVARVLEEAGGADHDAAEVAVWRRDKGDALDEAGKLDYENKAYDTFFQLSTEYPCLSFDVVQDGEGGNRTKYPLSMRLVCGTQAHEAARNELVLLQVGNICRTKHDVLSDDESETSFIGEAGASDEDDDPDAAGDDDEVNNGEPTVLHRTIAHYGTANRVRCAPVVEGQLNSSSSASASQLVAVWSDAGHVQIFDLNHEIRALVDFSNWSKEQAAAGKERPGKKHALKFCTPSSSHKVEGYGLDWSTVRPGVFASGDCAGALYAWQPSEDGRWRNFAANTPAHGASIEEIQWSPTQAEVLITARAGGTVEVWDVRDMQRSKLSWRADPSDINVADWNAARQASHLLVTGADSGAVAVWDLRKLATAEPIQALPWHTKSITAVAFSPHNESVLAVSGDDGQCTLWDLSLERDPGEEQGVVGELFGRGDLTDIPDQLMFQHQGLTHPKEVHWHPQIPGMVIVTDYNGLHLFKPMNWRSLMK